VPKTKVDRPDGAGLETANSLTPEIRNYLLNLEVPELTAVLADKAGEMTPGLLEETAEFLLEHNLTDQVVGMLANPAADLRAQSAEILGYLALPGGSQALIEALGDRREEVRLTAVTSLTRLQDSSTIIPLAEALGNPGRFLPARVAEVLLAFGEKAVAPLIEEIRKADPEGQALICEVLGQIGDARAVPVLMEVLRESSSEKSRAAAAQSLGAIPGEGNVQALLEALKDSHWSVRAKAAEALGRLGDPQAQPALKIAAEEDLDWNVQAVAQAALHKL
jgi:HEAT repeat protein